MAKYRVLSASYLQVAGCYGPRLVKAGEVVEYDGWPSARMEAIDADAKEVKAVYDAARGSGRPLPKSPAEWREGGGAPAGRTSPRRPPHAPGGSTGLESRPWRGRGG